MIPGTEIESAAKQREAFDRTFTLPIREPANLHSLALVQAGGHPYALPLQHVLGIEHERSVITAPTRVASLVGLSSVGGSVLPVFSLAALLYASAAPMSDAWFRTPVFAILETAGASGTQASRGRVGIAFERPLQFVRVEQEAFHQVAGGSAQTVEHEATLYTVLNVSALLESIMQPHATRRDNVTRSTR